MSSDAYGSTSFDDNDLDLHEDISISPHSPRPAKRRRLNDKQTSGCDITRPDTDDNDNDEEEEDSDNDSIQLPEHPDAPVARKDEPNPKQAPKRRIHQPKFYTDQEPMFVTQLTQPPSSPSRIRGPRWQKPQSHTAKSEVVTPATVTTAKGTGVVEDDDGSDEELKAAIVASLKSFRHEESSIYKSPQPNVNPNESQNGANPLEKTPDTNTNGMELDFDLDDLPEDAFDSTFNSPQHPTTTNNAPIFISSQSASGQRMILPQTSSQSNFRQTTLFGGIAPTRKSSSSQSASRSWPLANQNESPTHHQLVPEALKSWVFPKNLGTKRDYQFNIAQRALFHNLLVALPTGLGKTFIAATVMLNWYRWTKDAQIVFVAPTKPLVSQQVGACYNIVGIPKSQTTMLNGTISPGIRAQEWQNKRVFFMTPQTLNNDLKTGIADPKRIVLLVVDEAHRATGAYVYVEAVKFIQRFNTSFRVLALTATPGSSVETVQEVIDGLNISRIEIRTEESLDIRDFVHDRNVEIITFNNSEEMEVVMELFSKALQPVVDKLRSLNAYWGGDPMSLTPFGLTEARKKWMMSPAGKNSNWGLKGMVNSIFTILASLAHAIELLKYHGIGPFFRNLSTFQSNITDAEQGGKGGKYARQIADDGSFKSMMNKLRTWNNKEEFVGHPKLEYLKQVVLNHFLDSDHGNATGRDANTSGTRIMIFSHFRDSAEEIVRVLKKHSPIVLPHVFVGQANAKGSEGMGQKAQLDIIKKFKDGIYNTLVATSIGEEGLDIGEVDLIVCCDASASPIRMLQRMGRTGRKRAGNVVLLLMKGKEEDKYLRAKDNYEKMQQMIASGSRFTYHDDKSPRIVPREVQPYVEELHIEIPVENVNAGLPEPSKRGRAPKRPPKKFHMPDGVEDGFTKASKLGTKKKTKKNDNQNESRKRISRSPELAEIPPLHEVLLTPRQELELKRDFQTVAGNSPQIVRLPRNDVYPALQRSCRPTRIVRHGKLTRRMVKTLRKMAKLGPDCDNQYKSQLNSENVELVNEQRDQLLASEHEEDGMSDEAGFGLRTSSSTSKADRNPRTREDASPPYSSLMCTQESWASPRKNTLFPSQVSFDDLDFPDVDTLLADPLSTSRDPPPGNEGSRNTGNGILRSTARKRRHVISDDSDDLSL